MNIQMLTGVSSTVALHLSQMQIANANVTVTSQLYY